MKQENRCEKVICSLVYSIFCIIIYSNIPAKVKEMENYFFTLIYIFSKSSLLIFGGF